MRGDKTRWHNQEVRFKSGRSLLDTGGGMMGEGNRVEPNRPKHTNQIHKPDLKSVGHFIKKRRDQTSWDREHHCECSKATLTHESFNNQKHHRNTSSLQINSSEADGHPCRLFDPRNMSGHSYLIYLQATPPEPAPLRWFSCHACNSADTFLLRGYVSSHVRTDRWPIRWDWFGGARVLIDSISKRRRTFICH